MADNLDWLRREIAKGLMQFVVLHLDGGPSHETVEHTAGVWFTVFKRWPITWDEALDIPRIENAFLELASQSTKWPSPSQFRTLMPSRVYQQSALPEPDYPPEKAAANLRKIKEMIAAVL